VIKALTNDMGHMSPSADERREGVSSILESLLLCKLARVTAVIGAVSNPAGGQQQL